jgi:hypothetical protein
MKLIHGYKSGNGTATDRRDIVMAVSARFPDTHPWTGRMLPEWPGGVRQTRNNYPWDDWTNGRVWSITKGIDYQATTSSMRALLYQNQTDRVKCRSILRKTEDGKDEIVFQYVRR